MSKQSLDYYNFINYSVISIAIVTLLRLHRLISSSIRDNVLIGQPYKEKRYRKVLSACDLDIDIAMLPAGDLTEVGDNGMMLSGKTFKLFILLSVFIKLHFVGGKKNTTHTGEKGKCYHKNCY
jgi:hypothetical protein